MDVQSLDRRYSWTFYHGVYRDQPVWSAGRVWIDGKTEDLPLPSGPAMGPKEEVLQAMQAWLTEEFEDIFEAAMGEAVLRSLMGWVESYCATATPVTLGLELAWPGEEGQGVFEPRLS